MNRFTPVKLLSLILSTLLLTSCSGPDSSGGVEFSKTDNSFPNGDCRGSGYQTHHTEETGCGWITSYYIMPDANLTGADLSNAYLGNANLNDANLSNANLQNANLDNAYLDHANLDHANLSNANLQNANLNDANLAGANLTYANLNDAYLVDADLSGANLSGVLANKYTFCPNGHYWNTAGNNCPF